MNKTSDLATQIVKRLRETGHEAYFTGGSVRDMVMGQPPKDIDVATSARPQEVQQLFPKTIPIGIQFGVVIVVLEKVSFEVATFRSEGPYSDGRRPDHVFFSDAKTDASRRDFTINGLFYDPASNKILDFVGGKRDIADRLIRTIGEPAARFEEDRLRLLRAVRFASNLNFEIEEQTFKVLKEMAPKIRGVSQERIRDELVKLFTRPHAGKGLELLSESGLLKEILPEVEAMKGVAQPKEFHPEGDVFVHTKLMLDQLEGPSIVLAFGCLLHDVGKPPTFEVTDRIRFNLHAKVGAQMADEILTRLRFPNNQREEICTLVQNHMRFMDVQKMREGKLKMMLQVPTFLEELEMHRIDCLACHGNLDNWHFLKQRLSEYSEEELKPKPLVSGDDLLSLGMKAGPSLGRCLEELWELQLEGTLKTKEEALVWARQHYPPLKSS